MKRTPLNSNPSGRTPTYFSACTWSLEPEHPEHPLASCKDGFDGIQLLFPSDLPHVLSLDSCLSGHPSVTLEGIMVDLSPWMCHE
ncbi:hypothetical protein DSO57_1027572 [Entomophthora muscae]|uniref:Uncharacterized protein n=1 Tax=Entomophthora muscae TaxID=34485 RepID=A0ACC2SQM4_9FUNG|nr:hypothetical protein DSO57_1027572 [Entomophthora muscae]